VPLVKLSAVGMMLSHLQNKSSDTIIFHILVILAVICKEYEEDINSN
jgi:hypothetical protein